MSTDHDTDLDPEETITAIGQPTDVGIVHTFCGKILQPYTFVKRSLVNRLAQEEMSGIEFAAMFLWALELDPVKASSIRGEEKVAQALLDSQEWAQDQGFNRSPGIREEAMRVVQEIRDEADKANNWEIAPKTTKGPQPPAEPGNG